MNFPPPRKVGLDDDPAHERLIQAFVHEYQDGRLSRRDLLKKLGMIFGSAAIASAVLAACAPAPTPLPANQSARPNQAPEPTKAPAPRPLRPPRPPRPAPCCRTIRPLKRRWSSTTPRATRSLPTWPGRKAMGHFR